MFLHQTKSYHSGLAPSAFLSFVSGSFTCNVTFKLVIDKERKNFSKIIFTLFFFNFLFFAIEYSKKNQNKDIKIYEKKQDRLLVRTPGTIKNYINI